MLHFIQGPLIFPKASQKILVAAEINGEALIVSINSYSSILL